MSGLDESAKSARRTKRSSANEWIPRVVLGIDPANRAGAAIVAEGGHPADPLILVGRWTVRAKDWEMRRNVVGTFREQARHQKRVALVMAEKWTPGGRFGVAEAASCGVSFGAWRESLYRDFPELIDTQIDRVIPQHWKSKILKTGSQKTVHGEKVWTAIARVYLSKLFRDPTLEDAQEDELVAICCALYELRERFPTPQEASLFHGRMRGR